LSSSSTMSISLHGLRGSESRPDHLSGTSAAISPRAPGNAVLTGPEGCRLGIGTRVDSTLPLAHQEAQRWPEYCSHDQPNGPGQVGFWPGVQRGAPTRGAHTRPVNNDAHGGAALVAAQGGDRDHHRGPGRAWHGVSGGPTRADNNPTGRRCPCLCGQRNDGQGR